MYYYYNQQIARCSPRLQALLREQDRIIQTNCGLSEQGPILAKIIRLAKEEKQGFVYITAVSNILFYQAHYNEPYLALPYAALFLREGTKIFEETLQTETYVHDLQRNYMICFREISALYIEFYEISTDKIEKLYSIFKKNIDTCGSEAYFYESRLMWELMCRNVEAVKKTCKHYETLPLENRCYVCSYRQVSMARILLGDLDGALALIADFISGNVPPEARERYEDCESANLYDQYAILLDACLYDGKIDLLDRVIPLMYQAIQTEKESRRVACYEALVYALYGDFTRLEAHVKEAAEEWEHQKAQTPYDYMYGCLIWMAYFNLLSRSDISQVHFPTEHPLPLMTDCADKYRVCEIADMFEQKADEIGSQFEKSRRDFAYAKRKDCFRALMEMSISRVFR